MQQGQFLLQIKERGNVVGISLPGFQQNFGLHHFVHPRTHQPLQERWVGAMRFVTGCLLQQRRYAALAEHFNTRQKCILLRAFSGLLLANSGQVSRCCLYGIIQQRENISVNFLLILIQLIHKAFQRYHNGRDTIYPCHQGTAFECMQSTLHFASRNRKDRRFTTLLSDKTLYHCQLISSLFDKNIKQLLIRNAISGLLICFTNSRLIRVRLRC